MVLAPGNQLELATSLYLERDSGRLLERAQRQEVHPINVLADPRHPSSPIIFVLERSPRLDLKKLTVVNRLMRIVPHHGLALLILLSERELIDDHVKDDMRRKQTHLHLQSETDVHIFKLVVEASDNDSCRRFYKAITDFLNLDDETFWNRVRADKFVEFE